MSGAAARHEHTWVVKFLGSNGIWGYCECGASFHHTRAETKLCSDKCRRAAIRERQRRYEAAHRRAERTLTRYQTGGESR